MPQRVRLQKNQRVFRCAAFCCGIFFLISTAGSLGRAEEPKKEVLSSAGESGEKESSTTKGQDGANVQEVPAKGAGEAKKTEALLPAEKQGGEAPAKEEPLFFTAEEIYWGGSDEKSVLEIVAEEKVLPGGSVEVGANSRSLRWRPSKPLVIKMKKTNEVDSPLLQRVIFRENVVLTKRLGIEAPYYALDEIQMFFGSPVSYDLMQDGNWVSIECTPQKKKEEAKEVLEAPRKEDEIPLPEATSPAELLGTFFENKELYEAYITGSGRGADLFRRFQGRRRTSFGLFDGAEGFPDDMAPVFKEAYPGFGTPEYWQRHVRAEARQTFGYSSDFDGTYGSWGSSPVKEGAFTMQPDIDVMYNGLGFGKPFYGTQKPTGSIDLGYKAGKIFPVAQDLGFGDGLRSQIVSWGGNYRPNERYVLSCQNTLRLFGGKTVWLKNNGEPYRQFRRGYRLTNAVGADYRLTKQMVWKNGAGVERTLSLSNDGKARDSQAFLTSGLEQAFTKNLQMETTYGYRHLYYDKDPNPKPSPYTKGKDIHSLTGDLRYKISSRLFANGGPDLNLVDGDIFKFGGHARLKFRWKPQDQFQAGYDNTLVQNGSAKIIGGLVGRNGNSSSVTLSRFEITRLSYWHSFGDRSNPKTKLALSFEYRRNLPMSGVYGQQSTKDDGFNLQTSWIRKLRRGKTWLELTYRFSTYRSKAVNPGDTTDISNKENAVFFVIRNYFGEWGEMI